MRVSRGRLMDAPWCNAQPANARIKPCTAGYGPAAESIWEPAVHGCSIRPTNRFGTGWRGAVTRHVSALLLASASLACPAPARAQQGSGPDAMRAQVVEAVSADARVASALGPGPYVITRSHADLDKDDADALAQGRLGREPKRQLTVLMTNRRRDRAAEVALEVPAGGGTPRVIASRPVNVRSLPITREDAEEALALVKRDEIARRAIGESIDRYVLEVPSSDGQSPPYSAQILHTRSSNPRDPCYSGRCLAMIFLSPEGYLPRSVTVNLANRRVTVHGGS
jgi:hypothetical protein